MICRPCATGANLATMSRTDQYADLNPEAQHQIGDAVRAAHEQCVGIGCTCQHQIDLSREATA